MALKNKVFCIGMFKTGTKSFGQAMRVLGYKVLDRPWFILKDNWYNNPKKWPIYFDKIKERANMYEAFSDAPWMFLFKQLDVWYPNSKFILTLRKDALSLAKSDRGQWRGKPNTPSLERFMDRYNKHNKMVSDYFKNRDNFMTMCFERGDGWVKLCKFLDINNIPLIPFPHLNKGRYKR